MIGLLRLRLCLLRLCVLSGTGVMIAVVPGLGVGRFLFRTHLLVRVRPVGRCLLRFRLRLVVAQDRVEQFLIQARSVEWIAWMIAMFWLLVVLYGYFLAT